MPPEPTPAELALAFCRTAANATREEAEAFLEAHPALPRDDLLVALMRGDRPALAAHLEQEPAAATAEFGPGVSLLLLACHSRYADGPGADLEGCLRLLVEGGADPAAGAPDDDVPGGVMTPLAAAAGAGGSASLCATLLELGAPARDGAALYRAAAGQHWGAAAALLDAGDDWNARHGAKGQAVLHWLLDSHCVPEAVEHLLAEGADPDLPSGQHGERPLHVAVRRRRLEMVELLVRAGASVDAPTSGGMTAWRHALRREFPELGERLAALGADTTPTPADELALALLAEDLPAAQALLEAHPDLLRDAPPEELRLLPDLASKGRLKALAWLLDQGVDPTVRGLDGGTALHCAGWFGVPEAVALLVERGAPVHLRGDDHDSTPLAWVTHGSRFSGDAEARQDAYAACARTLLEGLAPFPEPEDRHDHWQLAQASEAVAAVLAEFGWPRPAS